MLNYLDEQELTVNLVGLEKSGIFVEHAKEIEDLLNEGSILLLSNKYIYGNILPYRGGNQEYAATSYYGGKIIYKTNMGKMYVATVPIASVDVLKNPNIKDYMNLLVVLRNLEKLRCDMYDNALFPVALVNKLVSLSSHPSSNILERFSKERLS